MTRKLKKGGYTAVLSIIVIAAVVVLNMIAGTLPQKLRQWDMSGNKIYSVGSTTKELAEALDKDVTIYVIADPASVDERITRFVNGYSELSDRIKIETVDSVLHPEEVNRLKGENNTLLVKCEENNKTETIPFSNIFKYDQAAYFSYGQMIETEFDGEGQLTSAISYVTADVQKSVYQVEGHGEAPLGTGVFDMLEKSGLNVNTVNLLTEGKITEDCELLIINSPESDLADDEKNMVEMYMEGGGKTMIIAGYSEKDRPNLETILRGYGLKLEDGLVADTKSSYQNNPYFIFPTLNYSSEIVAGIDEKRSALILQPTALTQVETLPAGVTVEPFMETSDAGVLVTEQGQVPGTYILGAAAEKEVESGVARLTVFSTPALIDDGLNKTFSNLVNMDLFMNSVTANFDDVSNISIPAKSMEVTYNTVTSGGMWALLFILVIPVMTVICGLVIWMKRRRL